MELQITTGNRIDIVDVTEDIAAAVPDTAEAGVCTVFVPHTTSAVIVNEYERRLIEDLRELLDRLVPEEGPYRHDEIDANADAHLRATLLGESVSVPVTDGALDLGTWQSILLCECDGPRTRTLRVRTVRADR